MDIRIGVTDNPREITVTPADDADRNALKEKIEAALAGESATLWLTDNKGRDVAVSGQRIAYVEVDPEGSTNPIGFS